MIKNKSIFVLVRFNQKKHFCGLKGHSRAILVRL